MSLSPNYGDPFGDGTPQPADCHACGRPVDPETCQLSSKGDDIYICAECVADDAGEPEPDVPLGCWACVHCGHVSNVYQQTNTCRSCSETVCLDCAAVGSFRDEDERGYFVTCDKCAEVK